MDTNNNIINNVINSSRYFRQLDIIKPEQLLMPIHVIGAGAVGTATVIALTKMGCSNIMVYDYDDIEEHNISNQMCYANGIGKAKVDLLRQLVYELNGIEITTKYEKCTEDSVKNFSGIIIVVTDNMEIRNKVYEYAQYNPRISLIIDARMGAEIARAYFVKMNNISTKKYYERNLYDDEHAEEAPCSAKSIIYCPGILGNYIAYIVKAYAKNELDIVEMIINIPRMEIMKTTEEEAEKFINDDEEEEEKEILAEVLNQV